MIVYLSILHLALGVWMVVGLDLFVDQYNPILKPIVVLFWPFGFVMVVWKIVRNWLNDVKEYYEKED